MNITDEELLKEFTHEIKQLAQQNMTVTLRLRPDEAMALIAAIQLACRHPRFTGPSSQVVRRIVDWMQSEFPQYGVLHVLEVIRRGWEPQYDERGGEHGSS